MTTTEIFNAIYHKDKPKQENDKHGMNIYCPYTFSRIIQFYNNGNGDPEWWTEEDHDIVWDWIQHYNSKEKCYEDFYAHPPGDEPSREFYYLIIDYYFENVK